MYLAVDTYNIYWRDTQSIVRISWNRNLSQLKYMQHFQRTSGTENIAVQPLTQLHFTYLDMEDGQQSMCT